MTEQVDKTPMDRSGWPKGPWDDEPDRHEWRTKALSYLRPVTCRPP
jgi:hypothetical protein